MNLQKYLDFAMATAYEAGRLTLGYFRTGLLPEFKADDTPVTLADKKAEELIRWKIEKTFPEHDIVGEEFGARDTGHSHRWFIDPIDGTKAFIRGVPLYAVLLGLEIDKKIAVGVCYFPALDEMLSGARGMGSYCNGRAAHVSDVTELKRAYFAFTDPLSFIKYGREKEWARLQNACYHRVGWSDAYGHALVATGRLEVMIDPIMNSYDCGPFPVILSEAGGYFGDLSGNETIYGNEALCTTQRLLPEVLRVMQGR
jgi:histidinol-phosphatase